MIKLFGWSGNKEVRKFVYETSIENVFRNHHYISRVFKALCISFEGEESKKVGEFMVRFSLDYDIYVKIPNSEGGVGDELSLVTGYIDEFSQYKDRVKGYIWDVRSFEKNKGTTLFDIKSVILGRVVGPLFRNGVGFYMQNSFGGVSLSDLIVLRKEVPGVSLSLDLHASEVSGARFMEFFKTSRTLGGLTKNFSMVVLTGTGRSGEEVVPASLGDRFSINDYKEFLNYFNPKLLVYRGGFEKVLELHSRLYG